MEDTVFIADTNVAHWIDINCLLGDVFTTGKNLLELENIQYYKNVPFLQQTRNYFRINRENVVNEDDPKYGFPLHLFSYRLGIYNDILAKNIVTSYIKDSHMNYLSLPDPGEFADRVLHAFHSKLKHHPEIVHKMTQKIREDVDNIVSGVAFMTADGLIEGIPPYNRMSYATTDRKIVALSHVLPCKESYILSKDTDVKLLWIYAQLSLGGNRTKFVDDRRDIPPHLIAREEEELAIV